MSDEGTIFREYIPQGRAGVADYLLARIERQRVALAEALSREWPVGLGGIRAWHAAYYVDKLGEMRVATVLQRQHVSGFEVGVVRDVGQGEPAQFKALAMTTLAAVVFLGLHYLDNPPGWELAL